MAYRELAGHFPSVSVSTSPVQSQRIPAAARIEFIQSPTYVGDIEPFIFL